MAINPYTTKETATIDDMKRKRWASKRKDSGESKMRKRTSLHLDIAGFKRACEENLRKKGLPTSTKEELDMRKMAEREKKEQEEQENE